MSAGEADSRPFIQYLWYILERCTSKPVHAYYVGHRDVRCLLPETTMCLSKGWPQVSEMNESR